MTVSEGPDRDDSELDQAIRQTKAPQTLEERQAFASAWNRVVGRPKGPITLGRHILLERVGSGATGVVYAAYDPKLDRKVAIKLLRTGDESEVEARESRARLLREAQAMAKLAHPNVIAVHDVGTYTEADLGGATGDDPAEVPSSGVFLVMELVDGHSLSAWLRQSPRPWREILPAFIAAGRGLAAAHKSGLVHRDFKPGNVLYGDDGRVRVLDFGLARWVAQADEAPAGADEHSADESRPSLGTGEETTRRTGPPPPVEPDHHLDSPLTGRGVVMGTPAYMAPEQHRAGKTDARTDQFSFCVALFEALYGDRPFRGETLEALRDAKERGDLPASPPRSEVPAWLHNVIARGLRPNPDERHESMDALLAELERDPAAQRRRWFAAAGVVLATALVSAGVVSLQRQNQLACAGHADRLAGIWDPQTRDSIGAAFLATGKPYAARVWDTVAGRLDDYTRTWGEAREETCAATVRGELSPEAMGRRMLCLDRQMNRVEELSRLFLQPDADVVEHSVQAVTTLPGVGSCLADTVLDAPDDDAGTRARVTAVDRRLARSDALRYAAKYDSAAEEGAAALAAAEQLGHGPLHARALLVLGRIDREQGDVRAAEARFERALELAERHGDDALAVEALAELVHLVGAVLERHREGARLASLALAKVERHQLGDLTRATLLRRVAQLEAVRGRYAESLDDYGRALALLQQTLGPEHPRVAEILEGIGAIHVVRGGYDQAYEHLRSALSIRERTVGLDHPQVAKLHEEFARLDIAQGRYAQADEQLERALKILRETVGENHPRYGWALHSRGFLYNQSGRHAEGLEHLRRARTIIEDSYGKSHPSIFIATANIGVSLWHLGRTEEALEHAAMGSAGSEETFGPNHIRTISLELFRARVLSDLGRHEEGLEIFDRNRAALEQLLGAKHPRMIEALSGIGKARVGLGQTEQGVGALERALALGKELGLQPSAYTDVMRDLAAAVEDGDPERAAQLRAQADDADVSGRGGLELGRWVEPFGASPHR